MTRPRTPTAPRSQPRCVEGSLSRCSFSLINIPLGAGEPSDTRMMLICLVCDLIPTFLLLLLLLFPPVHPWAPLPHAVGPVRVWNTQSSLISGAPQQVSVQGSMAPGINAQVFHLGIDLIAHSTGVEIPRRTELDLSPVLTTYLAGSVTLDQKPHPLNLTSLVTK